MSAKIETMSSSRAVRRILPIMHPLNNTHGVVIETFHIPQSDGPVTVRDQNGNLVYEGLQKKGFPLRMHGLHSELVDIIRKEHRRAMHLV